jgi:hypothetical protein
MKRITTVLECQGQQIREVLAHSWNSPMSMDYAKQLGGTAFHEDPFHDFKMSVFEPVGLDRDGMDDMSKGELPSRCHVP